MTGLLRYRFALLGHSQRYLPPALAYVAVLGVLYTDGNAPVPPESAVSAGAMTVFACWITVALLDLEDPVQQLITRSHARRPLLLTASAALAVLILCVPVAALSAGWAAVVHGGLAPDELWPAMLAHLACAFTGIAVGLPCSRMLVPRPGYSVALALAALAVVLLVRQVPLVNPMLRAMGNEEPFTGHTVTAVLLTSCLLVLSVAVTNVVTGRRA
ncbi:hypothetical protein CFN78_13340 [Amycolatopsis antarctica]|uniref:ABC transporter n=1 Tax=Amycolatopsis antarctica TaxID=1854586 RepID=A0A263D335_9PSEU|nr:hypothetical protein [Amycolatopsis antarctica]OZM72619.1 hypothetical protein CFN78_13340 [Amycolatopsis antarctica]